MPITNLTWTTIRWNEATEMFNQTVKSCQDVNEQEWLALTTPIVSMRLADLTYLKDSLNYSPLN